MIPYHNPSVQLLFHLHFDNLLRPLLSSPLSVGSHPLVPILLRAQTRELKGVELADETFLQEFLSSTPPADRCLVEQVIAQSFHTSMDAAKGKIKAADGEEAVFLGRVILEMLLLHQELGGATDDLPSLISRSAQLAEGLGPIRAEHESEAIMDSIPQYSNPDLSLYHSLVPMPSLQEARTTDNGPNRPQPAPKAASLLAPVTFSRAPPTDTATAQLLHADIPTTPRPSTPMKRSVGFCASRSETSQSPTTGSPNYVTPAKLPLVQLTAPTPHMQQADILKEARKLTQQPDADIVLSFTIRGFKYELSAHKLFRLLSGRWLNDEIMSAWSAYLNTQITTGPQKGKIWFLDAFFYNGLRTDLRHKQKLQKLPPRGSMMTHQKHLKRVK